MTESSAKPRYEPPTTIDLGSMAKGKGICSTGNSPNDLDTDCTAGPNATQDCSAGGSAYRDCTAGTSAKNACTAGVSATVGCTQGSGL